MKTGGLVLAAGLSLISLLHPFAPAMGFYAADDGDAGLYLSGSLSAGLGLALYPEDEIFSDAERETPWNTDLRLLAEGYAGEGLRAGVNVLQYYRSTPVFPAGNAGHDRQDVERSGLFFLAGHGGGNTQAAMVLDTCRRHTGAAPANSASAVSRSACR